MPNVIEINDFSAPELDIYARLTENQLVNRADPENALFIAESPVVIERALDAGCMPVSMLMETKHVDGKGRELIARCGDIPVFAAPLEVLTELTGFHLTRGMLCAMRRPKLPEAAELCRSATRIAVLENVMNPTNIGAIFRSAAALGMDAVLLTCAGSDPLYRRAPLQPKEGAAQGQRRFSSPYSKGSAWRSGLFWFSSGHLQKPCCV